MATRGSGAPGDGGRRRIAALGLLPLALVVALVAGSGGGAARLAQDAPLAPGGAQVVAQGVAPLPEGEAVWRVAYHPLEPGDGDAPDPRPLGFLLADAGEVLLTEEPGARQTLLAPGEAAFGRAGEQRRAPAGDDPAAYFALELVPPGTDGGDGRPVFLGPPFAPPPGARDLNLLRALLAPGQESAIRAGAAPTLVLATDGAVRVESSDGASAPLRAGEAAVFAGDLTITAEEDAAFVAAVVGPQVSREGMVGTPLASPVARRPWRRPRRRRLPAAPSPSPSTVARATWARASSRRKRATRTRRRSSSPSRAAVGSVAAT